MADDKFIATGIAFEYDISFWGHISHPLNIHLSYANNGDPLFTKESLTQLRAFLYTHKIASIAFNLKGSQAILLAEMLGKLIKSLPALESVYFFGTFSYRIRDDEYEAFIRSTPFESHLSQLLETSLAHPTIEQKIITETCVYQDDASENQMPSILRMGIIDYDDKRTEEELTHHLHLNPPGKGLLSMMLSAGIKHLAYYYYGDTESRHMMDSSDDEVSLDVSPVQEQAVADEQPDDPSTYNFSILQSLRQTADRERQGVVVESTYQNPSDVNQDEQSDAYLQRLA